MLFFYLKYEKSGLNSDRYITLEIKRKFSFYPKTKSMVNQKYIAIAKRSFKTKLELFLFETLRKNKSLTNENVTEQHFLDFTINDENIQDYENAWHVSEINGIDVKEFDKQIETWLIENTTLKTKLYQSYFNQYGTKFSLKSFEEFYDQKGASRSCFYCKLSEGEFSILRDNSGLKTKRGRGKQMEIDRINSNKEYTLQNVVLACYWCNNAKTDEFDDKEFGEIAKSIENIWRARLLKINRP